MGKYDPDPGRRRRRGKRSKVPPQLRAWVYGRRKKRTKRKPRTTTRTTYKRRIYDPEPRRRSFRKKARGFMGKIENWIDKYGGWIGGLGALIVGFKSGYDTYVKAYGENAVSDYWKTMVGGTISTGEKRNAEIMNLIGQGRPGGNDPFHYIQYKFGFIRGGYGELSAWAAPFWLSLITWIGSKLPLPFKHARRIQKPLGKIAGAALAVSTIGALALPGCPDSGETSNYNPPSHTSGRMYVYGK